MNNFEEINNSIKNNDTYEVIRELICLSFYITNNFNYTGRFFLGMYKINKKIYEVYSPSNINSCIFIKCRNDSLLLMVENKQYREYFNGPLINELILHINNYKNISINDIDNYNTKLIPSEKIINTAKISLNYPYPSSLFYNPNDAYEDKFEKERYAFHRKEDFDTFLKQKQFIPKMDNVFEPKIILKIIEQIYSNFKKIYIYNKTNGTVNLKYFQN